MRLLVDVHMDTTRSSSTTVFIEMNSLGLYLLPLPLTLCEGGGNLRMGLTSSDLFAGGLPFVEVGTTFPAPVISFQSVGSLIAMESEVGFDAVGSWLERCCLITLFHFTLLF